jgi:hypothetical protein
LVEKRGRERKRARSQKGRSKIPSCSQLHPTSTNTSSQDSRTSFHSEPIPSTLTPHPRTPSTSHTRRANVTPLGAPLNSPRAPSLRLSILPSLRWSQVRYFLPPPSLLAGREGRRPTRGDKADEVSESRCRAFIQSSYPLVKKANPDLPILIREALGTPARAFARFGESSARCGLSSAG